MCPGRAKVSGLLVGSARALIVEAESGKTVAESTSEYIHAVLDKRLPSGKSLKIGTALQVPSDYIKALSESVRGALKKASIKNCETSGVWSISRYRRRTCTSSEEASAGTCTNR